MSCPVCNHTMENLGSPERRIFWCGRCGTLKETNGDFERVEMPANLRHVVAAAELSPPAPNNTQHVTVEATFRIDQYHEDRPRIEQIIYRNGRRFS